jgi:excinuclease ABC subunit B
MKFKLKSRFKPAGGQPKAIKKLVEGYKKYPKQTLLGITGSGKTFVMSNVIEKVQKPTLVLAHNKTLAAQLYAEFKELFPENRVEYFISYYDYYQPESYVPTSDTYIEKDSSVNEQIEKMRIKTISSLLSRNDVIVVASISCIYGAGNPEDFKKLSLDLKKGTKLSRIQLIHQLVAMQYSRNDMAPTQGEFRVRGDVVDIFLADSDNMLRVELFGDEVERMSEHNSVSGELITKIDEINVFPAKQFVVIESKHEDAMQSILHELDERLPELADLEAQRLKKRVQYDMDMLREMGYCTGIENYSRHFEKRKPGEPPFCLLDYFPKDFLFIIDESHQSLPQSRAMYKGDYSRKKNLIDYGFRLPSAFDNRPLKFNEFEKYFKHTVFVSATPADYEFENSGQVVELIIRPTGLLDPIVEVRGSEGQVKDLIKEIRATVKRNNRVFVTTLTKKMAENLTEYLAKEEVKVRYMHSDINSLDRIELIRALRAGEYDVLVGINLLREGLDVPEVELVAILDADKEGFLRNERSFIQTIGRAARNVKGRVIMYADKMTGSMRMAIAKTKKRREDQIAYNKKNNITPKTVEKSVAPKTREMSTVKHLSKKHLKDKIVETEAAMKAAGEMLDFEKAIGLRDYLEMLIKESEYKEKNS